MHNTKSRNNQETVSDSGNTDRPFFFFFGHKNVDGMIHKKKFHG